MAKTCRFMMWDQAKLHDVCGALTYAGPAVDQHVCTKPANHVHSQDCMERAHACDCGAAWSNIGDKPAC